MDKEQLLTVIRLSKKKDHTAFKKLVEYYQDYAFSLAFRIVCDEEEAKDIVQESFMRIWQHIVKFNINTKFTTWLYKIVFNLSLDKLKAGRRRKHILIDSDSASVLLGKFMGEHPETDMANKELAAIIHSLAENLTPRQRTVFVLRDLQGAEMDEIAEITSLSKGAVKSNLYYARLNIRERLQKIEKIKIMHYEV